ncbi:MAG: winged helix-turn-helix domain-containing protein [Gemmatimonadales bacterium]
MRPPAKPSSSFYHPVDAILGTPAAVRILRVLSLHQGALSRTTIAQRAGLGRAGTNRALERLVHAGVVAPVGDASRPLVALSAGHPLATQLRELFHAEAARTDDFFSRLRNAAATIEPAPAAVWLIGSTARSEDSMDSDVDVAVVVNRPGRFGLKLFNRQIHEAAAALGVRISMIGMSVAELSEHARINDAWWRNLVRDAVPLVGREPGALIDG